MKKLSLYFALILILFISESYAQRKPFRLETIYKVKSISTFEISPDGNYFIYQTTEFFFPEGRSKRTTTLYNIKKQTEEKIEVINKNINMPKWNRSGEYIYFLTYKKNATEINRYNIKTKRMETLFETYGAIEDYRLSTNEKAIIFSKKIYIECYNDESCAKLRDSLLENGPIQAYVADGLLFRHWDSYKEGKIRQLFIYNIDDKSEKIICKKEHDIPETTLGGEIGFTLSPDGNLITFSSKMVDNPAESTNNDVYIYNLKSEELLNITENNKAWDGYPVFSPDGKYIAYKYHKRAGFESDKYTLAIYELDGGKNIFTTETIDNNVKDVIWGTNSKSIYFSVEDQGYLTIYKYNLYGKSLIKLLDKSNVLSFQVAPEENFLIYTASWVDKPVEIYAYNIKTKREERLTNVNTDLTREVEFRPVEEIWVKSYDGALVHTFIVKPYNFASDKKYPLILNVHGGPQMMWRNTYRADWQIYPGYGYIVVFANPRGSTGYGQSFTDAISGDWGGKVYEDLMAVVDSLEKLPYVDKERIGAMGWSYGGYMVNWFQAKTKRFKCLASMMGIFDLHSFYGTTEELWFPEWDLKGTPWESEDYNKFNPMSYVENFSTPTLIITGKRDYRVSYTQSLHYFTYLQKRKIPSRLIIFKEEGHWPNHIKAMPLYYNAHLEWFNKYLGGEPAPYDSEKMSFNLHLLDK